MDTLWEDGNIANLSEDEIAVRDAARRFAREVVRPLAEKIDKEHYFPRELLGQLSSLGFLSATVGDIEALKRGERVEASGANDLSFALIIEELATECATTAIIVSAHHSLALRPIVDFGTLTQQERYLPPLISGRIGCFALTEPESGSDAVSMRSTATSVLGGFIINGSKAWITNGPESDVVILFVVDNELRQKGGDLPPHKSITAFVHPLPLTGVTLGKREDKLGIRGSATCTISYDNLFLGEEAVLGERGRGFQLAMSTLNAGRIGVAAQAVGIARSALRDALEYAHGRKTFGKILFEHQSISNYIAEMITAIDASRLLVVNAARLKEQGKPYIRAASMAKFMASQTAMMVADKGLQIHGGNGYSTDYAAERHYRDAKITEIYEGSTEIQKMVIARELCAEYYSKKI
jgi:alkylation response protein AidB-like acyl-CoA dehydrogenase